MEIKVRKLLQPVRRNETLYAWRLQDLYFPFDKKPDWFDYDLFIHWENRTLTCRSKRLSDRIIELKSHWEVEWHFIQPCSILQNGCDEEWCLVCAKHHHWLHCPILIAEFGFCLKCKRRYDHFTRTCPIPKSRGVL